MATLKYRKNSSSPWETLKALPQTGTVRYDLAQSLDTTQQRMARSNIGAAAASDVANAVGYEAQSGFTNLQREQACENIGAITYLMDQILNETEKAQARKNIGAAEAGSGGTSLTVEKRTVKFAFPDHSDSLTVNATLEANSIYLLSIDINTLNEIEAEYDNVTLFRTSRSTTSGYAANFPTTLIATDNVTTLALAGKRSTTAGARTLDAYLYLIKIS